MTVRSQSDSALADHWRSAPPAIRARARWQLIGRPEQLTPPGEWNVWLYMAGRGAGKTRSAAEDMAYYAQTHPGARLAVVAPTFADARDTCIEGESGILDCLPREDIRIWNRSLGELLLHNGARFKLFSGDEPDRLRGPQHHRAWCDELAAFKRPVAWDMLMMGLRLGDRPQAVVTTTPKPGNLMRGLLARKDVTVTRGSTFDNAANLAPAALASLKAAYGSTQMGRQELYGDLLEETQGALWKREWINAGRVITGPEEGFRRLVLALDPSDGTDESDEQAWCLAGAGGDGHFYVADSEGMRVTPLAWLKAAIHMASHVGAAIVVEKNHGGQFLVELLERAMAELGVRVPYKTVHASDGKRTRAELASMLYEQGANTGTPVVHHIGDHPELEDQMANWTGEAGIPSPDRMDALVWALAELSADSGIVDEEVVI